MLVLERAPEATSGGNSRLTAGAFRCVYDGVDDLRALMPDLTDAEVAQSDFGSYRAEQFFDDMGRSTRRPQSAGSVRYSVTRPMSSKNWVCV